jgi:hypothetical protein
MKKYTIEDLAQGRCAVINDGSVEELREVLRRAFPDDQYGIHGRWEYYCFSPEFSGRWACHDDVDIPTQSVKDFLVKEKELFQYEYKWYDVREVLPDERFDGVCVAVQGYKRDRVYGYYWDNDQEAFVYARGDLSPAEWIFYWCPLPNFPQ